MAHGPQALGHKKRENCENMSPNISSKVIWFSYLSSKASNDDDNEEEEEEDDDDDDAFAMYTKLALPTRKALCTMCVLEVPKNNNYGCNACLIVCFLL
jgi:hypothetical protein